MIRVSLSYLDDGIGNQPHTHCSLLPRSVEERGGTANPPPTSYNPYTYHTCQQNTTGVAVMWGHRYFGNFSGNYSPSKNTPHLIVHVHVILGIQYLACNWYVHNIWIYIFVLNYLIEVWSQAARATDCWGVICSVVVYNPLLILYLPGHGS